MVRFPVDRTCTTFGIRNSGSLWPARNYCFCSGDVNSISFVLPSAFQRLFLTSRHTLSKQPDHLLDDADSAVKKLGKDRADKGSYLFRSLLERKTTVAFGSDWPVRSYTSYMIILFCRGAT